MPEGRMLTNWELYEICKQELIQNCVSSEEYERKIRELTQALGI